MLIFGIYLISNPYKPTDKDYDKNNILYTRSRIVGICIIFFLDCIYAYYF